MLLGFVPSTAAQEPRPGPIAPPPDRPVIRIPRESTPEPPPLPPAEIIRRFSEKEEEFARARARYTFHKTIRVVELDDDGKPIGEFSVTTEPAVTSDGKLYEKIIQQPPSTLRRIRLAPEDLEILSRVPPFPFTPGQLPKYELAYAGKQQVDELNTYVFRAKPRSLERARAYFEGLAWVDDRDLLVVKTYGKWVTETGDVSTPDVPFTMFETYREYVDNQFWFPTYARSDDVVKVKKAELRIRMTIRWTDYKPLAAAASAPAVPPPASPPSAQPPQRESRRP